MRGSYSLREWEVNHLTGRIFRDIERLLCGVDKKISYVREDVCPYNIDTILTEQLGYEHLDEEQNNHDFWNFYKHPQTGVELTVFANVESFELVMYLTEEE